MAYYGQQQQQPQYPPQHYGYPAGQPQYPPQHQPYPHYQQQPQQPQYGPPQHYAYPAGQQQQQQPQYPPQHPTGGFHSSQQPMTNPRPPAAAAGRASAGGGGGGPLAGVVARRRDRPAIPDVEQVDNNRRYRRYLTLQNEVTGKEFTEEDLLLARNEHNYPKIELFESVKDHKDDLGRGVLYYFEFIKFLGLVNCIFFILQLITYVKFASDENPSFSGSASNSTFGRRSWYHDFMITTYSSKQRDLWLAMNSLAIIFCFVCSPLYYYIMHKRELEEIDEADAGHPYVMVRLTDEGYVDVSDQYRTRTGLYLRRATAWFVLFFFLGIQVAASYFITRSEDNATFGTALAISIIAVSLNGILRLGAKFLTEFEKWETYGEWKMFHTVKLLFFKLCNIITVYAAKDYRSLSSDQCTYDVIGEQFMTLLLVEIVLMNLMEVVMSMFFTQKAEWIGQKLGSVLGNEDLRAPFDLAMQYLTSVYRQYLCIMAMVVFPMSIGLGGVIGFFVQYWVDKFRLFKICGRPRKMHVSQKEFLAAILICIAVVSMFTPFAGSVFMMSGITRDTSDLCKFP